MWIWWALGLGFGLFALERSVQVHPPAPVPPPEPPTPPLPNAPAPPAPTAAAPPASHEAPPPPASTATGTGKLWVIAPHGLHIRSTPHVDPGNILDAVPFGHSVNVVNQRSDGWAEIKANDSEDTAFVCNTCPEGGGGPFLSSSPPAGVAA